MIMNKFLKIIFGAMLLCNTLFFSPPALASQDKLILSVTPPLFQLNIGKGEFWASSVKIINNNSYDLTVYASVVNFEAQGEGGQGKFMPIMKGEKESGAGSLASWIEIEKGPITIKREQSADIPFSVRIPENAGPGGHYAAILVGTNPLSEKSGESQIKTSALVSSLLFTRVAGEIIEDGYIREFASPKKFYQKPEVPFVLRFENRGNVHLLPQGDITIYNMWGKEMGKVPINQKTDFGNVLPHSVRKFDFQWKGEPSIFESGKYKAIVTLGFGENGKQNVSAAAYFWVVPVKPAAIILSAFLLIFIFIIWSIRLYIRRALALEKGIVSNGINLKILAKPLMEGVVDLRKEIKESRSRAGAEETGREFFLLAKFARKYALFLAFTGVIIAAGIGLAVYFSQVFTKERKYDVIIRKSDGQEIFISSDEIKSR